MKRIVLLFALMIVLKPVWPVLEYVLAYDYIVENLCVNKDKPAMHCNGTCFLTKNLSKAWGDKKNAPSNRLNESQFFFPLFFQDNAYHSIRDGMDDNKPLARHKSSWAPSSFVFEITHPPQWG